ncbi:MAG: sigma-70 family RNA polymerase sigma factor [Planctomycetota bacterium]|jgi:RNA polymerase sigma factor (sigma-70 family)
MPTAGANKKTDTPANVEAVAEVFSEYGNFIRTAISFHVGDKSEAEDLFQDLFLHLTSKPMPREIQNMRGFLYKMISDMIRDAFRRTDRYQARIRTYATHNGRIVENRPERALMEVEEAKRMFDLIERRLPRNEAMALRLKYKENNGLTEIADKLGVKPRSVSRYVSIGLRKMRYVFAKGQAKR